MSNLGCFSWVLLDSEQATEWWILSNFKENSELNCDTVNSRVSKL